LECRGSYGVDESADEQIFLSIFDVTAERKAHETIACLNEKLEQKVFEQNNALNQTNQELLNQIDQLKLYKRWIMDREAMLNSIFNAATEGIVTTQMSGLIVFVNDTVESIFGYQKQELINCGINIRKIIPVAQKKTPNKSVSDFDYSSLSGAIGEIKEVTGVRKDGTKLPLDISIAKFSIEEIDYLTIIIRDATSRKLQEERAQSHLDELAHVTRLGLMGELASGIAHEVNQPLEAICAYSQACIN
jgi:PAS domain S-box-containing protein